MKTIFKSTLLLAAGLLAFTACEDDNESNPTLTQPTSFELNAPEVAGNLDLEKSATLTLTWSQPRAYNDFDTPVVPTYTVQLSPTASFNTEYDADAEDNTGADYISLDETYSSGQSVAISTETIDRALMQLQGWEEDAVPATLDLAVRIKSAIRDASFNEYKTIYSNVINVKTVPYYMELTPADPEIWWLIGGDIGDGSWGGDFGKCVVPMQTVDGATYDQKAGQGEIQWIGYLGGNGFKLRGSMDDNWATQIGQGDNGYVKNDGGSGNITVEAGLYKITLNTAELAKVDAGGVVPASALTIEKYGETPTVFSGMSISGSFNDWGDTEMLPSHTYAGAENHDWYVEAEFAAGTEWKVKQTGSWDYNRGGALISYSLGAYAYGVGNGDNFVTEESGKYLILFNDITGYVRVIKE